MVVAPSDSQREIIGLYEPFCRLDCTDKGYICADEFMGVLEFAVNRFASCAYDMTYWRYFQYFEIYLTLKT